MSDHVTHANRDATPTPDDVDQAAEAILAIAAVIDAHQKLTAWYNTEDPVSAELFRYVSAGKLIDLIDTLDSYMRLWAQRGLLMGEDGSI